MADIASMAGAFDANTSQRSLGNEYQNTLAQDSKFAPQMFGLFSKYGPQYTQLGLDQAQQGMAGYANILKGIVPSIDDLVSGSNSRMRASELGDMNMAAPQIGGVLSRLDPTSAGILDTMGQQAQSDLAAGSSLTPSMRRELQQYTRQGQSARGMGMGPNDNTAEVMTLGQSGQNLMNQRRQFAGSVVNQRQQAYDPLFGYVMGRQGNVNAGSVLGQGSAMGSGGLDFATNYFNPQSQYSSNLFGMNYNGLNAQAMANSSQQNQSARAFDQTFSSAVMGAAMCWVARAVYGERSPKWKRFREWLLTDAPASLLEWYVKSGESFAEAVKVDAGLRDDLRIWMDECLSTNERSVAV